MSSCINASRTPCESSVTVSCSGHLVALMRLRNSVSSASGKPTRNQRMASSLPVHAAPSVIASDLPRAEITQRARSAAAAVPKVPFGTVPREAAVLTTGSVIGGGGQVQQPVVGGEQPPDQAQGDHCGGGGGGGKDQEHDDGLDQDGLQRSGTGQDEPGHGPGQEHQASGFGGFDLRGERGTQGRAHVGGCGLAGGLAQRQAGLDLVAFVAKFVG